MPAGPRAVDVIVYGGIAAGLLGKDAFAGGTATAALGLFLHFLIACGMGAVYWLACLRWPSLVARPLAAGVSYGVLTWLAMNYVIVPLSRAMPAPFIPAWFIDGLLAHILLVGLLLAFVARRSALQRRILVATAKQ